MKIKTTTKFNAMMIVFESGFETASCGFSLKQWTQDRSMISPLIDLV